MPGMETVPTAHAHRDVCALFLRVCRRLGCKRRHNALPHLCLTDLGVFIRSFLWGGGPGGLFWRLACGSLSPLPHLPRAPHSATSSILLGIALLSDVLLPQSIRCDRARPQSQASRFPLPSSTTSPFPRLPEPMAAPVSRTPSSPAIVPSHPGHHSSSSSLSTSGGGAGASAVASPFGGTVGAAGRGTVSAYAHPDALKRAHPGAVACVAIVGKAVSAYFC